METEGELIAFIMKDWGCSEIAARERIQDIKNQLEDGEDTTIILYEHSIPQKFVPYFEQ